MKKKSYDHRCGMDLNVSNGKEKRKKMSNLKENGSDIKTVRDLYNRYYKNQVSALYKAVKGD